MLGLLVLVGFGVVVAVVRQAIGGGDTAARRAGANAEARVARRLRRMGRSITVWNDVRIRAGRRTSQIDHVVWTPRGLVLIETKHWAGHLHIISPTEWAQDNGRRRRVMHSPEHQSNYHEQVMREVLRGHGLGSTPLTSIIVLTHPASRIHGHPAVPCVRLGHLRRWLRPYMQPDPGLSMPTPDQLAALWSGDGVPERVNRG